MGCVVFLVEGISACVLVDEAGSCLSGGHVRDGVLCGEGPRLLGKGLEISVYRGPYCVAAG